MYARRRMIPVVLLPLLFAAGCGSSEATGPKETLNDKEKQQIQDLQNQRQDEWKTTPKSR